MFNQISRLRRLCWREQAEFRNYFLALWRALMAESLALLLRTLGERQARAVVADIGTAQSLQAFDRLAAVEFACNLLRDGQERRDIAYKLAARYDISLKSAYRRISEALDQPIYGGRL